MHCTAAVPAAEPHWAQACTDTTDGLVNLQNLCGAQLLLASSAHQVHLWHKSASSVLVQCSA